MTHTSQSIIEQPRWQPVQATRNRATGWWLRVVIFNAIILVCPDMTVAVARQAADVRNERQLFQTQELTTSRFGGWIFQIGNTPRIIWRDVDEVRRLGRDASFRVRWFDATLTEFPEPGEAGRWMAWLEGEAPNGTPFRRSFTFFALPKKIENGFAPDLSIEFANFPGPDAPQTWVEHKAEFDRAAREFLTRSLIDSEKGAILLAGIAEAKPLGHPVRYVESTSVANDELQLALKLKMLDLEDKAQPLQPPRLRATPASVLHAGPAGEAGVPADAKVKIDAFCREWAAATGEPFVTLVARRGVIITHEAFGMDATGKPVDLEYRCWVASITKTVTALMFSQFVDQNRIDLDAPLSNVFPDFPVNDRHVPTFRQCLNHTAGLAGHGDFGGMKNPNLENVILNGIDVIEPGKAHAYSGMGFELVAKAMEIVAGKSAARIYDEHLFRPLGFGDVVMGNASSDGEFTAMELGVLAQWVANGGSYGDLEFVSPQTLEQFLPRPLDLPGAVDDQGLGMHRVRHRKPGAGNNSMRPEDQLFGPRTLGHGSFSGCILVVDPDQQLVITQVRKKFGQADNDWYARFFQTIAASIDRANPEPEKDGH
jgi:CubicO group peptidase (beta-lactamase class C family)